MPMVEVSAGRWKEAETLKGHQAERAREIALEKGQLAYDVIQMLPRLAGSHLLLCLPTRMLEALQAHEQPYTTAPIALEVMRAEKAQVEAVVGEMEKERLDLRDSGEAV